MTDTDASGGAPAGEDQVLQQFRKFRSTGSRRLRNALVEQHLELVEFHVGRLRRTGISEDDARQQAFVALIGAVERFDPDMGVSFRTFANRTVEGELKRQVRDRGWSVRPPRRLQELHLVVRRAEAELTHELGRHPRVAEIAERVDESTDRVLEALSAGGAYRADSLDAPPSGGGTEPSVGAPARGIADVEARLTVERLMAEAPYRDREVLHLRYFEGLTQAEIGERLGISQSYLSRVLRQALERMRERLTDEDAI